MAVLGAVNVFPQWLAWRIHSLVTKVYATVAECRVTLTSKCGEAHILLFPRHSYLMAEPDSIQT